MDCTNCLIKGSHEDTVKDKRIIDQILINLRGGYHRR